MADINELKALAASGGYSAEDIQEYAALQDAGYKPDQIASYYRQKKTGEIFGNNPVQAGITQARARENRPFDKGSVFQSPLENLLAQAKGGAENLGRNIKTAASNAIPSLIETAKTVGRVSPVNMMADAMSEAAKLAEARKAAGQPPMTLSEVPGALQSGLEQAGQGLVEGAKEAVQHPVNTVAGQIIEHPIESIAMMNPSGVADIGAGLKNDIAAIRGRIGGAGESLLRRQVRRLAGVPPESAIADTVLKRGVNLTSPSPEGQVVGQQEQLWPEIETLLNEPTSVPMRKPMTQAALESAKGFGKTLPGSPEEAAAFKYVEEVLNQPVRASAKHAHEVKTTMGDIIDWNKSQSDLASAGRLQGQQAAYDALNQAIRETRSNPERYAQANKLYGELMDLFARSEEKPKVISGNLQPKQPATKANLAMSAKMPVKLAPRAFLGASSGTGALNEKAAYQIGQALRKVGGTYYPPETALEALNRVAPARPAPITPAPVPMAAPAQLPAPAIPLGAASGETGPISPTYAPEYGTRPATKPLGLPAPAPESLRSPKMTGTPSGGQLLPQDLADLRKIAFKQPGEFRDIMNMLGMEETIPEANVGGTLPSRLNPETALKQAGMDVTGVTPEAKLPAGLRGKGGMVWFNDPATGGTFSMYESEISPESIQAKIMKERSHNWRGRK